MSKRVKILYFASLREQLDTGDESLDLPDEVTDAGQLVNLLQQRGNHWSEIFSDNRRLMISINQQMAKADTAITAGDEIAFFPPVTGG